MTRLLHTVLLLLLAAGSPVVADDAPVAAVKQALAQLNAAFEKGDAEAVKQWMTENHVAVTSYYAGPLKRADQLAGLADHKLSAYAAGDMTFTRLGTDAVLVTYPLTMKGTYKGKPVPAKSFASAVWVRQTGQWREAFYQETPVGSP